MNEKQEAAGNAVKERPILFSGPMVRALLDGSKTQTRRELKVRGWKAAVLHALEFVHVLHGAAARVLSCAQPVDTAWAGFKLSADSTSPAYFKCPYGQPGDRLWVRESWQYADWTEDGFPFIGYSADGAKQIAHYVQNDSDGWGERLEDIWADLSRPENYDIDGRAADRRWRPSIHMPRWASRILLEIVAVRVERLQDISEADARAEGIAPHPTFRHRFGVPGFGDGYYLATARDAYAALWDEINGPGSWAANPWVWVVEFKRVTP